MDLVSRVWRGVASVTPSALGMSLLAVVAAYVVITALRNKELGLRDQRLLDFTVGLVATFCGVAWALHATDAWQARQERDTSVRLLTACRDDVLSAVTNIALCLESSGLDGTAPVSNAMGVPRAKTLEAVLVSDLVLARMSPSAFKSINSSLGLIEVAATLGNQKKHPDDLLRAWELCGGQYFAIYHVLESEIEWQSDRATALARDRMIRHWWAAENSRDTFPGTWRHYLRTPAVRESLMEIGVEH